MKRHPRIRKTVKWGGAAVTVLLVVVWIGTAWWTLAVTGANGTTVGLWRAGLLLGRDVPSEGSWLQSPGFHASGPYDFSPLWWIKLDHRPPRRSWNVAVPLWPVILLSGALAAIAWRLDALARRRARLNLCPKCNYDRTGLAPGAVCPECGAAASQR